MNLCQQNLKKKLNLKFVFRPLHDNISQNSKTVLSDFVSDEGFLLRSKNTSQFFIILITCPNSLQVQRY